MTCKTVSLRKHGKVKHRQQCSTKTVSGTVKFNAASSARATLSRAGAVYATGTAGRHGLVLHARRQVRAGRYTLTLTYRHGGHRVVKRMRIRVT